MYSDEQINKARVFYKNFLDTNRLTEGEHASVLSLAAYLEANSTPTVDASDDLKIELESLKTSLETSISNHEEVLKQRDHNWNELQKAQKELATSKAQVAKLNAQGPEANVTEKK